VTINWRRRSDAECACCGSTDALEWDHILAKSKGGTDARYNFQVLCKRCNVSKGIGEYCQITHGEMMNELEGLGEESGDGARSDVNRRSPTEQADTLEAFSTRMHARKKAILLAQAKERGIAAGLIIEEMMSYSPGVKTIQTLKRLEEKLDLLLQENASLVSTQAEPRHRPKMNYPLPTVEPAKELSETTDFSFLDLESMRERYPVPVHDPFVEAPRASWLRRLWWWMR
jgi:hypothetical protein